MVMMEQDLERAEERSERSDRWDANNLFICLELPTNDFAYECYHVIIIYTFIKCLHLST